MRCLEENIWGFCFHIKQESRYTPVHSIHTVPAWNWVWSPWIYGGQSGCLTSHSCFKQVPPDARHFRDCVKLAKYCLLWLQLPAQQQKNNLIQGFQQEKQIGRWKRNNELSRGEGRAGALPQYWPAQLSQVEASRCSATNLWWAESSVICCPPRKALSKP